MSSPINISTGADAMASATLDALAGAGEHAGWHVLDTARTQQFTGEIVFQTQPKISVYLDSGYAYYAVRTGDPSLCDRLIEADVIAPAQIERGVIRVGNIENLGRLFDRDPSVDRDAVMVIVELATDDVVTAVANAVTSPIALTAYRHHASGVHRWFVAPSDRRHHVPAQLAPVGEVAQIDASVTSDLPGLPDDFGDGVHIEWDKPLGHDLPEVPAPRHAFDESMLQSILDTQVASAVAADDQTLDVVDVAPPVLSEPVVAVAAATEVTDSEVEESDIALHSDGSVNHFQIVWPDGSEQALIVADTDVAGTTPEHGAESSVEKSPVDAPLGSSGVVPAEEVVPPVPEPAPIPFSFELPALALADDNLPEDHQPEEVVDAVRRALEAIEAASAAPIRLASVAVADLPSFEPTTPLHLEVVDPFVFEVVDPFVVESRPSDVAAQPEPAAAAEPTVVAHPAASALKSMLPPQNADAPDDAVVVPADAAPAVVTQPATQPVVEAAPVPFAGFAPPTMHDSAEAVYARAAADKFWAGPVAGVASVVFVDEDPVVDATDRSGALKRLIGSLRRK
jgi:hypothetical protein